MTTQVTHQTNEPTARPTGQPVFTPRVDIQEIEDAVILMADMPGVTADDLDIRFEDRELAIHGKVSPRHSDAHMLYTEYEVGDFHRTFNVSDAIDADQISAELKNGVLTVRLPKSEAVKPRRIAVKSN